MPGAYNDLKPGAQPVAFTKFIAAGAADTLLWRVPWGNPVNKVFEPRKIIFSTAGMSGGTLIIWDQDLSSATPTKNGSAGAALISVGGAVVGANASGTGVVASVLDLNQCPQIVFQAGLTCQSTVSGTSVTIEGQIY